MFARVRSQVPNVSELAIVSRCRRCKSLKEQLLRLFRFSFSLFPTADEMKQTIPPFFFSAHRADESRRILKERECEILARFVSLCYSDGEKIGAHSGLEKRKKKIGAVQLSDKKRKEIKFLFLFSFRSSWCEVGGGKRDGINNSPSSSRLPPSC